MKPDSSEKSDKSAGRIFVRGIGAVSPAGWGLSALRDALCKKEPLPTQEREHPGSARPLSVRQVPPPSSRPAFLGHPRLRRSSPITHYAAAAGLEAIGGDAPLISEGKLRLGIVLVVMAGCVNYTRRFYEETLRDPSTASPLVFPETVFNAPASHIAALLGTSAVNFTLVGDPGTFLQGIAIAANWLAEDRVDAALVIGSEEIDWTNAHALGLFQKRSNLAAGAGALYVRRESGPSQMAELRCITDAHLFLRAQSRREAIGKMRAQLQAESTSALLCDSRVGIPEYDADESSAWSDWQGAYLSPKVVLGEGMIAAAAWQCVAAIDALMNGAYSEAVVSLAGCNEQAIGARFAASSR